MKICTISNEKMTFSVSTIGAEPKSLKTKQREWLLQHKNEDGTGLSPILFPLIGPLHEDKHTVDGIAYPMPMHGFAKTSLFEIKKITDNFVTLTLVSDDDIAKMYPYEFELSVNYIVEENRLITEYIVENKGDKPMYYAIGSHIGFCLNTKKENYTMVFDRNMEKISDMTVYNECDEFSFDGCRLDIKDKFFEKGCITIGNHNSKAWRFVNREDNSSIAYKSEDFPYFTLWSIPKEPFICLESWSFRSTHFCSGDSMSELPEICVLAPGESKSYAYTLEFDC